MLVVRKEIPEDQDAVYQVVLAAFESADEADLVNRLRPLPSVISLIAELEGELVGHIMFSPVRLIGRNEQSIGINIAGLAPVAVSPNHQKKGIGKRLIIAGLEACQAAEFVACVLLGHPDYYPKFGFKPALPTFNLTSTYKVPDPVFMALELIPNSLNSVSGTIHYHPTFAGV